MASFNKIMIVGYLGRDPEIRYTPQGTAVCQFTIATTEKKKDRSGEAQDVTTWFRITAWGRTAELANQYLAKGRQVYVEGRLRQEEFTDREGRLRQSLEVNATEVHFLGKNEGAAAVGAGAASGGRGSNEVADDRDFPGGPDKEDDDIPF